MTAIFSFEADRAPPHLTGKFLPTRRTSGISTSELLSPISGEVTRINTALKDSPELVNDHPYGEGWMFAVKLTDPSQLDELMSAEKYLEYLEGR